MRNILLISMLLYLISCTSSDNNFVASVNIQPIKTVKASLKKLDIEGVKNFNKFLDDLSYYDMVAAGRTDLHERAGDFLPDTTISEGYDMHIQEIGRIDTFRLVFHEYFDLYDDWSKTYLTIFSTAGTALNSQRLWDLSFEGNTSINIINDQIIEIAYHDFFDSDAILKMTILSDHKFHNNKYQRVDSRIEGTIYEYYKINSTGNLDPLQQSYTISSGRHFPQSSAKLLSKAELAHYNIEEIRLMKSEIMAEHGYLFQESSVANYFKSQDWYRPRNESIDTLISDIERLNLKLLTKVEQDY